MRHRVLSNIYWGFVLIVIGGLFLARNLGYIDFYFSFHTFWPLILIFVGLGWIVKSFERRPSGQDEEAE